MSAYCLARLGHKVLYVSDKSQGFIPQFYEGPVYGFDDILDESVEKRQASLPPSLYTEVIPIPRNADSIRDLVDKHGGKPDMVWFSGDQDLCSFAYQVSSAWRVPMIHADMLTLSPCVNEVQLAMVQKRPPVRNGGIISIGEIITDTDIEVVIGAAETVDDKPLVTFIGRYKGDKLVSLRQRYPTNVIPYSTDRGRFRALCENRVFMHPFLNCTAPTRTP
jgi:hypothetical protein